MVHFYIPPGPQGPQGNPGIGIKGDKGDKGDKGERGDKGELQFYAAFAGAKTSAFFRQACIERTMQLRVKLMTK